MKKLWLGISLLAVMVVSTPAVAGNCYSDDVVKGWIDERDQAEEQVLKRWARGESPGQFASDVAIVVSNELYICSKCRNQRRFLRENLHLLGEKSDPKVETVPGITLERLLGYDILCPRKLFPSMDRREVGLR